jgi:hypothetical protein
MAIGSLWRGLKLFTDDSILLHEHQESIGSSQASAYVEKLVFSPENAYHDEL